MYVRKARLGEFIFSELFFGDAVDLVFVSHEITDTLAFKLEAKTFAKNNLINSTLSIACWQNHKNITTCETQSQCFDFLRFQSFNCGEQDLTHSYVQYVTVISNNANILPTLLA